MLKKNTDIKNKLILFFKLLFIIILIQIIYIYLLYLNKDNLDIFLLRQQLNLNVKELLNSYGLLYIIISTVIISPIFEEGIFRTLIIISSKSFSFFIASVIYIILDVLFKDIEWMISLIIKLIISIFIYKLLSHLLIKFNFQKLLKQKLIVGTYILSSFLFGLMHLIRYSEFNFYAILLVIPQIIYGFIFGYIRIKNGMKWSISLHFFTNLPATILILFQML